MSIWFDQKVNINQINKLCEGTLVTHLGIYITKLTHDNLHGEMEMRKELSQPYGILHGGANCVLAETLGSLASNLVVNATTHHAVGLNISTSHIKAVRNGVIKGVAIPVHLGKTTHIWNIKTFNSADMLTSETTMTMAIIERLKEKSL